MWIRSNLVENVEGLEFSNPKELKETKEFECSDLYIKKWMKKFKK